VARKQRKKTKRGKGDGGVYQLADGSWRGFVTIGYDIKTGKQQRKYIRGKTQSEVREKLRKLLPESSSRMVNAPERVTVGEWLERYASDRASEVRPNTRNNHRHYITRIKAVLGEVPLHTLTAFQIRDFYKQLIKENLSPSVRQHLHDFLKNALHDAEKIMDNYKSPMQAVNRPKEGRVIEPQVWEAWEVRRFLEAVRGHRFYGVFYFTLTQGLRIGEVLGLKWSDLKGETLTVQRTVVFEEGKLNIGPPKTERGYRILYLTEDALEVLTKRREEQATERDVALRWESSDYIFSSEVGTLASPNNVRRLYKNIIAKMLLADLVWNIACCNLNCVYLLKPTLGVKYIRIHDQRHTYTTTARDAGIDLEVLADRLGQDPRVTAKTYSHITDNRRRKASRSSFDLYQLPDNKKAKKKF
jgi:integrase